MNDEPRLIGRTRSIARKQVARRRRLVLATGVLVSIAALLAAGWFFVVPGIPWFKIDQVTITGLGKADGGNAEIEATIRQSASEMSTLRPDEAGLLESLAGFPRVASVSMETDFPDAATVEVGLRRDGSIARASPDDLLIATDGRVLGKAGPESGPLPKLGAGPVNLSSGESLEGEALDQALVAGAVPAELQAFLSLVQTGEAGIEAQLTDGSVLVFGDESRARLKWAAAATVIADPELGDGVEAIDVSVPSRPGVRFGDGSEVVVEADPQEGEVQVDLP